MNKVLLTGRLTKDVETRTGKSGKAYASLSVATDDGHDEDGNKRVRYVTVKVFNRLAEVCGKFGSKGKLVSVEGKVGDTSYEKEGVKVYSTDVVANHVEYLSWAREEPKEEPKEETKAEEQEGLPVDDFDEIEGDVPF